jgi:RNA polymerase sigma-70 factor (ECF subfamily)
MAIIETEEFRALCQRIGQGDHSAMQKLFAKLVKPLQGWLREKRVPEGTAEDIVQETFLDLWKQLRQKVDQGNTEFFGTLKIGYVWRIAKNKKIDWLTRTKKEGDQVWLDDDDDALQIADDSMSPIEAVAQEQLIHAIAQLPETPRRVLHLEFIEGWTPAQIKDHFGWRSQATVNHHRNRGLQQLRKMLANSMAENAIRESFCA